MTCLNVFYSKNTEILQQLWRKSVFSHYYVQKLVLYMKILEGPRTSKNLLNSKLTEVNLLSEPQLSKMHESQ